MDSSPDSQIETKNNSMSKEMDLNMIKSQDGNQNLEFFETEKKSDDVRAITPIIPESVLSDDSIDIIKVKVNDKVASLMPSLLGSNSTNSPARPPSFEAKGLLPVSTSIKSLSSVAGSLVANSGTGGEVDGNSTEAEIRSSNSSLRSSPRSPSLRHLLGPSNAVLASAQLRRSPTLPPAPPSFSMFQGRAKLVTDASPFDAVGTGPFASITNNSTNGHASYTPVLNRSATMAPGPFPSSSAIHSSINSTPAAHVVMTK